MKKLILNWLFGTDDIREYIEVLIENREYNSKIIDKVNEHIKTLEKWKEDITLMRKLIKICENYGIDVDKEIKKIDL